MKIEVPIKTKRLLITEFSEGMAGSVHEISLDDDNRRFVPDEVFETEDEARTAIATLMSYYSQDDKPLVYPIVLHNGQHIGHIQAFPVKDGWEVGYHIEKSRTGRGYATEAVRAFLPQIMERLDIAHIFGLCHAENVASCKVLEKNRFSLVFEGLSMYHGKQELVRRYIFEKTVE